MIAKTKTLLMLAAAAMALIIVFTSVVPAVNANPNVAVVGQGSPNLTISGPYDTTSAHNPTTASIGEPFQLHVDASFADGTAVWANGLSPDRTLSVLQGTTWVPIGTISGNNVWLSRTETTPQPTYYYRLNMTFDGGAHEFYSAQLSVPVAGFSNATNLTAAASATSVSVNQKFTVSGTLTTTNAPVTPVTGKPVYLEASTDNVNYIRISANKNTNTGGAYSFSGYISAAGTYYIRANFDGTTTYGASVSNAITVVVR